ncbi:DNA packaging terminase subunit 1 [bovine alphaherpesvirus 1]|uniref:DNA packaging terminase subunit 1 n=1 Tax=Bovine herpesvirus 1 TaxID=10320 RepID=A0A0U2UYN0_BHV1|nr:UL15 protein [Bovine herpesvirus type 1.1]ALR87809.1 DNA packaging terminase subunit 1 [Bovine alphaherpesvirus 1]AFV53402.1 UL15 protein [Bovine herpesvirus type 1.1]AWK60652.1 DNA packaging terminase subunit 1 [Bovine alphaherpesvirus 1]QBH74766.1 DNA packaging terminase subunit 1 [Bovine alphaherpesvirus 1]QBH74840.1 DNA packaging terminase subunit 1 [Bovine alphaherpesvirus 1]
MFGGAVGEQSARYFQRLLRERQRRAAERGARPDGGGGARGEDDARVPFLDFAVAAPKRHQTVVPGVGTLHGYCELAPLFAATASRLLLTSMARAEAGLNTGTGEAHVSRELAGVLSALRFAAHPPAEAAAHCNAYHSVMAALESMRASGAFAQVAAFVARFSRLVGTSFSHLGGGDDADPPRAKRARVEPPSGQTRGALELFQKMILMHATYFVAATLLGDHAERIGAFLRVAFNTPDFSDAAVAHFRQRATVFLVPRRHGKTWFLVPLIALALATFKGIKIGYTAHIRKATEPVFEEIVARLRQWFGGERVDHVKGEVISFSFPDGARSTIVFASSHNTNGIRGQDFNLLFVDEANFIRPEAVQTIVGFLNQASCKIIFVSSTNTGKASTSFLYNLKGASDGLLNVVTYICNEHTPRVAAHGGATACSCYVLNKPVFITMDAAARNTAETFLPNSFMQEIIGGGEVARRAEPAAVFTRAAGEQFLLYRPSTAAARGPWPERLYMYIDPAFTSNARASGSGIAVVGRHRGSWLVLGLEHFFLPALTGSSAAEIARCAVRCFAQVMAVHRRRLDGLFVAVEGNSSQDSAVAIALGVRRELDSLAASGAVPMPAETRFYHCRPPGSAVAYPFFLLQKQKTAAFDHFIRLFNSGRVVASQDLASLTVRLQTDPVEYLFEQLQNLTESTAGPGGARAFSGKRRGAADDLMVALVMAVFVGSLPPTDGAFCPLAPRPPAD